MPAGQPQVWVARYAVCCLPPDHPKVAYSVVFAEWRGRTPRRDRWVVARMGECLNAAGEWEYEPRGSDRDEEWRAAHEFDLDRALKLAKQAARAPAEDVG
jgi:hypothetical protein